MRPDRKICGLYHRIAIFNFNNRGMHWNNIVIKPKTHVNYKSGFPEVSSEKNVSLTKYNSDGALFS